MTTVSQNMRGEPAYGPFGGDGIQSQQAWAPSTSNQATAAAMPTTSIGNTQFHRQEQPHLDPQLFSPATMQGNGVSQQVLAGNNVYFNFGLQPMPLDAAHFHPQASYGQDPFRMLTSTLTQVPSLSQHLVNVEHPKTIKAKEAFEQSVHQYPESKDPNPLYDPPLVTSDNFDAFINTQNCSCGPGCDCVFCREHPFNPATLARVRELADMTESESYWALDPHMDSHVSRPQSGYAGAPANGTNIEPVAGQGYLEPNGNSATPGPSGYNQPNFGEREPADQGDQSVDQSHLMMRNADFYDLEYLLDNSCTNTDGTCQCGENCACVGCVTHVGHMSPSGFC